VNGWHVTSQWSVRDGAHLAWVWQPTTTRGYSLPHEPSEAEIQAVEVIENWWQQHEDEWASLREERMKHIEMRSGVPVIHSPDGFNDAG